MVIPSDELLSAYFPDRFDVFGYADAAEEHDDMARLLSCLIYLVESVRDAGDELASALHLDAIAVQPGHEGAAFAPVQGGADDDGDGSMRAQLNQLGLDLFDYVVERRVAAVDAAELPWAALTGRLELTRFEQIAVASCYFARTSKKFATWFASPALWSAAEGWVDRASVKALAGVIGADELEEGGRPRCGRFFDLLVGTGSALLLSDAARAYLDGEGSPAGLVLQTGEGAADGGVPCCTSLHADLVAELSTRYASCSDEPVLLVVRGAAGSGRRTVARRVAGAAGMHATVTAVVGSAQDARPTGAVLADMLLSAVLNDAVPVLVCEGEDTEAQRILEDAVPMIRVYGHPVLVVTGAHATVGVTLPTLVRDMPEVNERERYSLWEWSLRGLPLPDEDIARLSSSFANRYALSVEAVARTVRDVRLYLQGDLDGADPAAIEDALVQSCYMARSHSLGANAQLIRSRFTLDDLVVDDETRRQIDSIMDQVRFRGLVGEQWGFYEKTPYGSSVSALFFGPPGTGKTMAVQAIGNELGLDVFRVDISALVSKYIGETEKNISELFDRARGTNAVLFFDEADALFAKRSDVGDSNDRHANAETAHLLQRLEDYRGVVILATNLRENIDDAFMRRMKFVVGFRLPRAEERRRLFRSMLPAAAPTEELSLDFFADRFELSGSAIKEVVINAAYLAARDGRIGDRHLVEALKQHYVKIGKRLSDDDFRLLGAAMPRSGGSDLLM